MSQETKDKIEQLISYYRVHSIEAFLTSGEERLVNFVSDDFNDLLATLEKELAQ